MSKPIATAAFLSVLVGLTGAATQATAEVACFGFFATGPAVCGVASVTGGSSYGPMTQTAAPTIYQLSGSSVEVGAGGGGTGVGGLAYGTGTFGAAHISTSSFSSVPQDPFLRSSASAQVEIGFVDGFTVGANDLNTQFTLALDGIFGDNGFGELAFNLEDQTTQAFVFHDVKLLVGEDHPTSSYSFDGLLVANHTYIFNWSMRGRADSGSNAFGAVPSSFADLSNTGRLMIDVLTPNEGLTFLSGANYGSVASGDGGGIPEPSTWAMLILGFGAIGLASRRRKGGRALAMGAQSSAA